MAKSKHRPQELLDRHRPIQVRSPLIDVWIELICPPDHMDSTSRTRNFSTSSKSSSQDMEVDLTGQRHTTFVPTRFGCFIPVSTTLSGYSTRSIHMACFGTNILDATFLDRLDVKWMERCLGRIEYEVDILIKRRYLFCLSYRRLRLITIVM
jgi:hypothetical protein